jgi:hypothetical protein
MYLGKRFSKFFPQDQGGDQSRLKQAPSSLDALLERDLHASVRAVSENPISDD